MTSFEITFTPISVVNPYNKSHIYYNELVEKNVWKWSDSKYNKAIVGDYFAFYFHNRKIVFHKIIEIKGAEDRFPSWDYSSTHNRNVLILSEPLFEIEWNKWVLLNGPQQRRLTYTTKNVKNNSPLVFNELLAILNNYSSGSSPYGLPSK